MALEVMSGAAYQDTAKFVQKPKTEITVQQQSTASINITEEPSVVRRGGSNQSEKEQGNTPNPNSASDEQIKNAISRANNKMKSHRTRCEFSYHEETRRVSIKVFDKETEEVIREIPPEEALEMIERMWELAGFLVDEKR